MIPIEYLRSFLNDIAPFAMSNYNEIRNDFVATNGQTTVTLAQTPTPGLFQILVTVNGLELTPGVGYTLDTTSTIVTFTDPLTVGDNVSVLYFTPANG